MKLRLSRILSPLITVILCITLWKVITTVKAIPTYIIPSPDSIFFSYLGSSYEMNSHLRVTLIEAFLGFCTGSIIGIIIGICLAQFRFFRNASLPILVASNAIPVIAFAPILIIWFGNTLLAKVAVASFISFFPATLNTFRGLCEYNPLIQDLFSIYGSSKTQFLIYYKFRNALPYIATGLKLNATLCVIGAIIAEFVSSDRGLGFGILQASYSFNTPKLWAYIILACLIGICFYGTISLFERIYIKQKK